MALHRKEQFHGVRSKDRPFSPALRLMRFMFSALGPLLPEVMGRWACRLWSRTRRFPEAAAGKRIARSAEREILVVDNVPVAVYKWGKGPVIIFVHGWSGRGSQVAAFVGPLAGAGYQVMAVDAPGHGDTPGDRTDILECAAVLAAFSSKYGPVYGAVTHSFGGMVLAYAMNQGVSIERVVCISAPAHVDYLLESFAQTLDIPDAVSAVMRRLIDQRFPDNVSERISTVVNVRKLSVPALIIHDEDDHNVPWQQGKMIADAWPGAEFMRTSGLGHGRILRNKAVVEAAVDFIKG